MTNRNSSLTEYWRSYGKGIPPTLVASLAASVMCCVFGAGAVTLVLAGVLLVLLFLQHMKNTPEE